MLGIVSSSPLVSGVIERSVMKATVCELRNTPSALVEDWQALVEHVDAESSDLVVLPEMPFYPWVAGTRRVDPAVWRASEEAHAKWMPRLEELGDAIVIGSRPVTKQGKRINEGFIREPVSGSRPVHEKHYLPDEEGYWEASWYRRGKKEFKAVQAGKAMVGLLICTEIWFSEHARGYAGQGVELLICPRATPRSSVEKWIAGGRAAAVISGAWCLSSNLVGEDGHGREFGGVGWIIEPEEGDVVGLTSREEGIRTLEIDLTAARNAKKTYPRYVRE